MQVPLTCAFAVFLSAFPSQEYNDALLVTYLSSMTKGTQLMADVNEKFQMVHSGEGRDEGREGPMGRGPRMRPGMGMMGDDDMFGGRGGRGGGGRGFLQDMLGGFGGHLG